MISSLWSASLLLVVLMASVPALAAWLPAAAPPEIPTELQFAIHRLDMAILGIVLALVAVAVGERPRKERRSFARHLVRGLGLRIGLVVVGGAILSVLGGVTSPDYWRHSIWSWLFHVLGPARMMAGQSLAISGLGLPCSSELLDTSVEGLVGDVAKVYVFVSLDAVVLAWLGMAGEKGLPPFRVFQAVSRIGLTVGVVSVPIAAYGGRIGYWGAEPFAWIFALAAVTVLASVAHRRE